MPRSAHRSICNTVCIATSTTALAALFAQTAPVAISLPLALGIVVAAAALSIPRAAWQYFGLFTTLVHELGHAVAAILTGRVIRGIRIRRDHSGDALSTGRGAFGTIVSGVFGYPAPAIVGLALLWSVLQGYTAVALFVGGIILIVTIVVIRNLFGAVVVVLSAAVSAALWFYASPAVQSYALLVLAIALLVGSVRGLVTVISVHTRNRSQLSTSDAYLLYKHTHVPSIIWLLIFSIVIVGCCALAVTAYISR